MTNNEIKMLLANILEKKANMDKESKALLSYLGPLIETFDCVMCKTVNKAK
jgi:hypothetical protein